MRTLPSGEKLFRIGDSSMRLRSATFRLVPSVALIILMTGLAAIAQQTSSSSQRRDTSSRTGIRNVSSGQKLKIKGSIVRRDADSFSVRDEGDLETIVLLTDRTSVKSKGGFFRTGKNYDVTSLLRGLPVEVE